MSEQTEIKKKKKNPGGRPVGSGKPIDFKIVEGLCKIQCTREEVSQVLGVSHDTLLRRTKDVYGMTFEEFYLQFSAHGKVSIRRMQFAMAETSAAMCIWLGKQYLGQSEKHEIVNRELMEQEIKIVEDKIKSGEINKNYKRFYN